MESQVSQVFCSKGWSISFVAYNVNFFLLQEEQLVDLQRRMVVLEQEIRTDEENRQLRRRIETLMKGKEMDREKIQLYQSQIQVLKEDFEQEREDRGRQHQRAETLSHRIVMLKLKIDGLKENNNQLLMAQRRAAALHNYERYTSSRRSEARYSCDDGSNQFNPTITADIADSAN